MSERGLGRRSEPWISYIRCPYCGEEIDDTDVRDYTHPHLIDCDHCDKGLIVHCKYEISFKTEKRQEVESDE